MFETLLKHFADSPLSLWGPFIVLILCGLGLPVPEDIPLLTAGYLCHDSQAESRPFATLLGGEVGVEHRVRVLG